MTSSAGASRSASLERAYAAQPPSIQVESRIGRGASLISTVKATAVFFALAVLLQWWAGAYSAEFSSYADEPAHFTTGLMLRDYVAAGFPANPLRYAENYYLHYPKVAIGHWPPLFYIFEALWLLVFPVSRISVMALMALYCAIAAGLLFSWISESQGKPAAFLTSALFVILPLIRLQTTMVMTENLLMIFVLLATFAYARYLETSLWRPAALFGAFASIAILVKGNAWELALVPPFAILLTRRFRLLGQWAFWLPLVIVMAVCGPWQIMTAHLVQQGWIAKPGPAYFTEAMRSFAIGLWDSLTPAIAILAIIGIAFAFRERGRMSARPAAMLALLLAVCIFHAVTPADIEMRHILPAVPALLSFVPVAVISSALALRSRGFVMLSKAPVIAAVGALFFVAQAPPGPHVRSFGFEQAAEYLVRPQFRNSVVLLSSEYLGEGIMIAETEMRERRPGHYILRATKFLARSDWSGIHYSAMFPSAAAVRGELDFVPVSVLVIDFTPGFRGLKHQSELLEMLGGHPPEWTLAGSFGPDGGDIRPVRVYVRSGNASTAREHLQTTLADELRRIEEQ